MEIKKVRKSDLEQLISKAVKLKFKLQDSDYKIDINTIYAVIKISRPIITRKNAFDKSPEESGFNAYIKLITFSNVEVVYSFVDIDSDEKFYTSSMELAINYEIIDE